MCHDCEYFLNQATIINGNVLFHSPQLSQSQQSTITTSQPNSCQHFKPTNQFPSTSTEVLQDKNFTNEGRHENFSIENSTSEVQDCIKQQKSLPQKKENKKCRGPKPRVKVVQDFMKQTLKMTTRSRTKVKQYTCNYCPSEFSDDNSLVQHFKDKHKFHKLRYVCKICYKEFSQQLSYENHASTHDKNHLCFPCNRAFLSKCELDKHTRYFHNQIKFVKKNVH